MDSNPPAHSALKLDRDMAMNRRIPTSGKHPRGRPRLTWIDQIKKNTGLPINTCWSRVYNRQLWLADSTALKGYGI